MDDITPELLDIDEFETEESLFRELRIIADRGQSPVRIDKFLVDHVANTSRNKIQQAADAGSISVNGKVVKSN
jgi:23S rRNA pseudouridine1911/1915/1917 synthase